MASNSTTMPAPPRSVTARVRKKLFRLYWKIEQVLTPGLRYSQEVYGDALSQALPSGARWLDLGCGDHVLAPWLMKQERAFIDRSRIVVGLDYQMDALRRHRTLHSRIRGDFAGLPFPDGTFDIVTANMVVEHLSEPDFREVARVLTPGGVFLIHTPNALGYTTLLARVLPDWLKRPIVRLLENRSAKDVFKAYYRANSPARLDTLAQRSGLRLIDLRLILTSAEFAIVTPLAVLELLWIRLLMMPALERLRPNIIAKMELPRIADS